ncbi:unnamed protein product, partial [Polarella glacialis]
RSRPVVLRGWGPSAPRRPSPGGKCPFELHAELNNSNSSNNTYNNHNNNDNNNNTYNNHNNHNNDNNSRAPPSSPRRGPAVGRDLVAFRLLGFVTWTDARAGCQSSLTVGSTKILF